MAGKNDFLIRQPMSVEKFIEQIRLSGERAKVIATVIREFFGSICGISALLLYPHDNFSKNLSKLRWRDYDMVELDFALEDALKLELMDDAVEHVIRGKTIGDYIKEVYSNLETIYPECRS